MTPPLIILGPGGLRLCSSRPGARSLGPIVTYRGGPNAGKLAAPDIENRFRKDVFKGKPHIVARWAELHDSLPRPAVSGSTPDGFAYDSGLKSPRSRSRVHKG